MGRRFIASTIIALSVATVYSMLAPATAQAGRRGRKVRTAQASKVTSNFFYTAPIGTRPGIMIPKSKR